jgi:tetratricopeptide (TPR) repeat protein
VEGTMIFRIEIITFFLSLWYVFYYIGYKIFWVYFRIKNIVAPEKQELPQIVNEDGTINEEIKEEKKPMIVDKKEEKSDIGAYTKEKNLTPEEKEKLSEIIKRVKLNTSKWYYEKAKALIVEGLAIDKYDTEINLELAYIYEEEKNYKNAEYIYQDLIQVHKTNIVILRKLWYILALQRRFLESIEIYEKVYERDINNLETIDLLVDLYYEIWKYEESFKYLIFSLKEKPRSVERMLLKAELLKRKGKEIEAIEAYKKVLEIQPYNTEAIENLRNMDNK